MTARAITFDFHDTLAICDRWFDLEVHDLVPAFLQWRHLHGHPAPDPALETSARTAYRTLRTNVIEHGKEMSADQGVISVLTHLGMEVDEEEVATGVEILMRERLEDVSPAPGAIETVRVLVDAGVPLGVVSSAVFHPFVEWALERLGLDSAFSSVTTSASAGFYKSRPEIYAMALATLGAVADQSVHVGDSFRFDVQGARRAGMRTVWLQRKQPPPSGDRADLTLPTLEGAGPALLGMLWDPGGASSHRASGQPLAGPG